MIVAALLCLVLPLCVDLFYAIPWPVRKLGGWVAFSSLVVACVARLWRVDPGDDAPPADLTAAAGWTRFVPPVLCAVMAVPYLNGPDNLGAGDWDLYLERYEAVRRTILEWSQFPWWDPWCRGGFPLAAGPHCGVFGIHTALAAGVLLTLAGWRLATTGLVYRDFPRHYSSGHDLTPWTILKYLLARPEASALATMEVPEYWDTLWYVGPVVLALLALSLGRGWRWWHTLTAGCIWLAAGSVAWYHPSYWLAHLPLFTTMHTVVHWRIMANLGFALAAADVLARCFQHGSTAVRRLALIAVISIAVDFGLLGCQVLPVGFRIAPSGSLFPGPPTSEPVQVADSLGFAAIQRGYGVIHLREPLLGYNQVAHTARLWRGHPSYAGEYWTDARAVRPRWWSPNRIVLQVDPGETVSINQNPGSWWLVNGRRPFSDWRCAETEREFLVQADARGRIELQIRPRGLELGVALHLAGIALIGLVLCGKRLPGIAKSGEKGGL
jgi:hypothetical protein